MFKYLEQLVILPNFLTKLNIKTTYDIPFLKNGVFTLSDKNQKDLAARSIPIYYGGVTLCSQFGKFTKIKKPVSAFKTRVGDLIGLKITLQRAKAQAFFLSYLTTFLPQLALVGATTPVSLNKVGDLAGGLVDIRYFPEFKESHFSRLNYNVGASFSFCYNYLNNTKKKQMYGALIFSSFYKL